MRRGLFGGTFDPPHIGHIMMAQLAYEMLSLDVVEFIPAGQPPHKDTSRVSAADVRVELVEAAITSFPYFSLSLMEVQRQGPSFTVDTLKSMKKKHQEDDLYWFVGADMLADLPSWKNPEDILRLAQLVVAPRPHVDEKRAQEVLMSQFPYAKITLLGIPLLDISSTWIKNRLAKGLRVDPMLSPAVIQLILQKGLYKT